MSLNRYEQIIFDYWTEQPEERRHWQGKVDAASRGSVILGDAARALERELWDYFVERAAHVPAFRDLDIRGLRRVSLLNLAEYLLRLWGPTPKPKKPASRSAS